MIEVGKESFVGTQVNVHASQILGVLDELQQRAPQKPDVSAPIERGDPVFDVLSQLEQNMHELMRTADADNRKFASVTGAVSETAHDIGRLLRLVQSNQEFWEPRWVTSRVLGKPSLERSPIRRTHIRRYENS
jgi:hypothetical protein